MTGTWIGGHHFVFDYIGENEIWISDALPVEERQRVMIHEFVERALMEDGEAYNDAHISALEAEGNHSEAEIQKRSYIRPEETKEKLNQIYPAIKENEWKVGKGVIVFDEIGGIIYLRQGKKVTDQALIRSAEDIEKFVSKYRK